MAKLADATDLGSVGVTHGGSSPLRPIFIHLCSRLLVPRRPEFLELLRGSSLFTGNDQGFSEFSLLGSALHVAPRGHGSPRLG